MRTITAGELATLAKPEREVTQRIKVANGSGTLIDLTAWVEDTGPNIDIDRPVSAMTVLFRRDSGTTLSLSPLRTDSTLNRLDDGSTYSPQLQGGRRITWEVATTPIGMALVAGDYKLLFDGFIDVIDFDHSPITCDCRDKGGVLVDRGIEVEAAYGSAPGVALETVMQGVLDATFGGGVVPLDTPVSPSYLISPQYIQQRQSMMDAMQALAQLPGWDARYWYDTASATFKFRLQQPPRTKTVPDYTFGPSAYYDITRLSIDRTNIKNVIAVSYFDTAALARLVVTVSDATSITKYGRRYFYLQEADGSPINTNAEATSMANAMLSDMKEPKAEAEIELPFFWPAELWDLYRFTANGVHINSDQDWAVVSINHKLGRRHHRTVLTVRGAPAGGYLTWLDRSNIEGGEHRPGEVGPEPKIEVFGPMTATQAQVLYTATGGTAPLTYQRRLDVDDVSTGTYSAPAALGAGVTEWITLHAGDRATRVFLRVIDATGLAGNADPFFLPGQTPATDPTTGKAKRATAFDDGKWAVAALDIVGKTTVADLYVPAANRLKIGTDAAPTTITKTLRVSHAAFVQNGVSGGSNDFRLGPTITPDVANTQMSVTYGLVFPIGSTLTAVRYRCYRGTTSDRADLVLVRANDTGGGTTLATLVHATTGWATLSAAISQLVGSENYYADSILKGVASLLDAQGLWLEFDYTVPDYLTAY